MHRRLFLRLSIVFALTTLFATVALTAIRAQTPPINPLTDPDFETGTTAHWTPKPGTTRFAITGTYVFSGQFAAAIGSDGSTSTKAIVQTVPVVSRTVYRLAGAALKNNPAAKLARLRVGWYSTDNCTGKQLATADTPALTADRPAFTVLSATVTAPDTARCAEIRAQMQPLDTRPAVVFFDTLDFSPVPPTPTPTPAPIIPLKITEVLYDALTPSTSGDEFAEICNPTAENAALDGYKIGDEETPGKGEGMYRFPDGTILTAGDCLLVAKNAAQFRAQFGFLPDFETIATAVGYSDTLTVPNLSRYSAWGKGSWALADGGDELLLLAPDDTLLDAVAYGKGDYSAVGVEPAFTAGAPFSLQRVSMAGDADVMPLDFLRDLPTPGLPPLALAPPPVSPAPLIAGGLFAFFGSPGVGTTLGGGDAPPAPMLAHARNAGLHFAALTDPVTAHWDVAQSAAAAQTVPGEFAGFAGFLVTADAIPLYILGVDAPLSPTVTAADARQFLSSHPEAVVMVDALPPPDFSPVSDTIRLLTVNLADPNGLDAAVAAWEKGWRVALAPVVSLRAPTWGADVSARVGVLAAALTPDAVLDALRAQRGFATTAAGLALAARFGGVWMGGEGVPSGASVAEIFVRGDGALSGTVTLFDGRVPLAAMVVDAVPFSRTANVFLRPGHFYRAELRTPSGDIALTAPVWVSGASQPDEILLNEVLPSPIETAAEWLELFNPSPYPVNLRGWRLMDAAEKAFTFQGDDLIPPRGYRVVTRQESGIALNNGGDAVTLIRADGSVADAMRYAENPGADASVCRDPDTSAWASPCIATPGAANIVLPPPAPLALSIWDAKHVTEGAWVQVTGWVTVPPGVFGKNTFYVQDETHGIRVRLPTEHGRSFAIGDHLEVTGFLNLYYNEWEIDVADIGAVRPLDGSRILPSLPVNSGMLSEGYEGLLVQMTAVPVVFKSGASFFADDGTGWAYVYAAPGSGIHRADVTLGAPMTVVGIVSQRTSANLPHDGYRLLPRAPFDLVAQLPPPTLPPGFPTLLPATGFAPDGGE